MPATDSPVAAPRYHKLPGRGLGWGGYTRLWLGDDHLLSVSSTFGVERYRRYFLHDIEAILLRRTARRLIWNCILGGIAGVAGAMAAVCFTLMLRGGTFGVNGTAGLSGFTFNVADGSTPQTVAYAVAGAIFAAPAVVCLVLLTINTLLGQTCAFFVQTAAGLDRLHAPIRLRAARRVIEQLAPRVENAQG